MTKKTFKRIQMLYKDGISIETTLTMLISLSSSATEGAEKIILFLAESDSRFVANIEKLKKGK